MKYWICPTMIKVCFFFFFDGRPQKMLLEDKYTGAQFRRDGSP